MDFDENLINLYISCPALYDKSSVDYSKSPVYKENLWKAISSEMQLPVAQCQTRVKQLRERFNREKKKEADRTKSGAGSSQGSSWPLMKLCSFWGDHIKPRNTISSMAMKPGPSQAETACDEQDAEDSNSIDIPVDEVTTPEGPLSTNITNRQRSTSESSSSQKPLCKKRRLSDDTSMIIDHMAKVAEAASKLANQTSTAGIQANDEEAIFAQYIISTMRAMGDDLREDLRIDIMQLLRTYKAKARKEN